MTTADDLAEVIEFRQRLVAHMNLVLQQRDSLRWGGVEPEVAQRIGAAQTWLAQEYGRLHDVINQFGSMMMSSPALGVTSHDVIQDAIHDLRDLSYDDIARISVQHIDTVIGRLRGEVAREERQRRDETQRKADEEERRREERERKAQDRADDPDRCYRLTSPVYWLRRLGTFLRWLIGTNRGRIVGAIGVIVVAIISGVVSGVAQGWFESLTR